MLRQTLVTIFLLLLFFLIISRLFYWQIIKGSQLAEAASEQYYYKLRIAPTRGEIRGSDASSLVINRGAYLVFAEPQKIGDKDNFSRQAAKILDLDEEIIKSRISAENIVWAPLKHKVDEETYEKLKADKIEGIGFEKESVRFYPEASMAAQLLGFVGNDEDGMDKGYFGIEGFYDRALKGKEGSLIQEKDARGLPIILGGSKRISAENGENLELYLDRTVQFILENSLKQGIEKYGAKEGLVAVIDPKTGGLLGSASFPSYDQREYGKFDKQLYTNPLIASTYEPGSTFKVLVMASALNEKVIEPKTIFNEVGPVRIGEYSIRTWNNQYHGEMSMTQVLEKSSNPGMVFAGQKLGRDKLYNYLKEFGLGEKTGIDIEGEEVSFLRPVNEWKEIDLATTSFGQGIAVTPIQMLTAVSVIANKGQLMAPQVVKKMMNQGKVIEKKPKKIAQVISPATAKVMTEMMILAVDNGEAKWAKPKNYRIAGKTGTAQIPVSGHYDEEKTIASFIGFAPADDPKFVMLVMLREPSSSPWGSETAAPLFFTISKELFAYYGISPQE